MKKSLSLLLSGAMVFGLFASAVSAAENTELTAQQKFEALKAKGIFAGMADGSAGLDQDMNRAQFARIAALLSGLDGIGVPDTKVVTEKPFSDVELGKWYTEEIAAVKEAELMIGNGDGTFGTDDKIQVQQLAVVVTKILGLEEVADAKVEGAADWAAPYIQALLNNDIAFPTNYAANATRAQLVEATYVADSILDPVAPAKVSVASAKATGATSVTVTLDKAVDTDKATLSLKKGTLSVATTTKFADDKKSAVLTLTTTKLQDGEYTVTLAGLETDEIAQASASFTAEKEQVKSIEFVNSSDTLALYDKNIVKLKALNQYGEIAAVSAGSFTVFAGQGNDVYRSLKKDEVTGELLLTLDTTVETAPGSGIYKYQAGTGIIPVNIYNDDTHVSVSKNFKMGTQPFISKMEISEVKYSNGKDYLGGKGESALINVVQYDQYGNLLAYDSARDDANIRFVLNGYEPQLATPAVGDSNNDDIADVKLALTDNVDKSAEYTFTIFNQAGNASGKLAVQSSKTANKVEFGDIDGVVAAGDEDAYIPVVAYDANGTQLSVDDLVNMQNQNRLQFSSSTGADGVGYEFVTFGENKGKLKLMNLPKTPKSVVSVTAIIATSNATSNSSKLINISDARVPERFYVDTNPKQKIVSDASNDFKFLVYDQYGKTLNKTQSIDATGEAGGGTGAITSYEIVLTSTNTGALAINPKGNVTGTSFTGAQFEQFNKGFTFATTGPIDADENAVFTATLVKHVTGGTPDVDVAKVTRKIEGTTDTLVYSVGAVADLYNAVSTGSVADAVYGNGGLTISKDDQRDPLTSAFKREVTLSAVDAAGNTVAIPKTIKQLTSSNPVIAKTGVDAATGKGYVIGGSKGTATLNVTFATNKGQQLLQTVTVNVKDDVIAVTKVERGEGTIGIASTNAFTAMNVKVTDNYGVKYEGATAQKYNYLFGVTFSVTNVVGGTVTVDQYGNITNNGATSYEITATSANGFSASSYAN